MSQSKASRARASAKLNRHFARATPAPSLHISDRSKHEIAAVVRSVDFTGTDGGGLCVYRALIGLETLRACGLNPSLVCGGLVYRAGPDPVRDSMMFMCRNGMGGLLDGAIAGHLWCELDGDLVDFSSGDWHQNSLDSIHAFSEVMEPLRWHADPPPYIWEKITSGLKQARCPDNPIGMGRYVYVGWQGPHFDPHANIEILANSGVIEHVHNLVKEFDLVGRLQHSRTDGDK